ncbi:intraflagellar transport protein 43 homolog isoform X1 [Diprion similis]|uniref:intraflagellar transport protein 43 homolog isoform X1 n=1 Tax=Diprion similis TaxID=362088 RepID=UPI001EF7DD86|nr:intraflagellar transport protein 43 homolog isoform X1 [Diprion similis]
MDWGMELEVTSKKLLPRLGRRAGHSSNLQEELKSDEEFLDSPISPSSDQSARTIAGGHQPVAPPRSRKTGWADEFKSGGKMKSTINIIEQLFLRERFRGVDKDEPEDEIPVIPDLDEIQEDNFLSEIANTHLVGVNRVETYKELDTDLYKSTALSSLDDVNLSLLTEKLYPDKLVREPDEVWNWDLLFTQIASEINSEKQSEVKS